MLAHHINLNHMQIVNVEVSMSEVSWPQWVEKGMYRYIRCKQKHKQGSQKVLIHFQIILSFPSRELVESGEM